jgi:hypothetical protein
MSEPDYEITTRRLAGGSIGKALQEPDPARALVAALVEDMDRGDGWIEVRPDCTVWFPHRHAVHFTTLVGVDGPAVHVETVVVERATFTAELARWLNDLNAQSAGWCWSCGSDDSIRCTIRVPASATVWWWALAAANALGAYVTTIDSMSAILAATSDGVLPNDVHATRGQREVADSWLAGVRAGNQEPGAALNVWLSPAERARCLASLRTTGVTVTSAEDQALPFVLYDSEEAPAVKLASHFHQELGWGLLMSTLAGGSGSADALLLAADGSDANRLLAPVLTGGWWYGEEAGLVCSSFVPAATVEQLAAAAGPTVGDVLSLMLGVGQRLDERAQLRDLVAERGGAAGAVTAANADAVPGTLWQRGPLGWSFFADHDSHADELSLWLRPRHFHLASWGIFNPMGPTVCSLELGLDAREEMTWHLYWLMRHPLSPEIHELAVFRESDMDQMDQRIVELLTDDDLRPFGSGCDWLAIFGGSTAVIDAADAFARSHPEIGWITEADTLSYYAWGPWARVSPRDDQPPVPEIYDRESDPVLCWLDAIQSPEVIGGMQLYLRTAWEGAKAYRDSGFADPSVPQRLVDSLVETCVERFRATWPPS